MINIKIIREYIQSDLYRHNGRKGFKAFVSTYRKNRMFKFTVWYRLAYFADGFKFPLMKKFIRRKYKKVAYKNSIDLSFRTKIGYGLTIHHGYGLVVNTATEIGDNVTLMHNITLADEKGKAPKIGNQVRFTPGCVIVGGVTIGDNCVIGANCVVTKDVPDNNVAVGIPNRNLDHKYDDNVNRYYWPPK
jgi:serine O-acetyltransferase